MGTTDDTRRFTALSARLTGFGEAELAATGMAEVYRAVAAERLGEERLERLAREEPAAGPDGDRAAAGALTILWYTGSWPGPAPSPVSARAYAQGLVWKAAGVAPPAVAPAGYGSWADRPAGAGDR